MGYIGYYDKVSLLKKVQSFDKEGDKWRMGEEL